MSDDQDVKKVMEQLQGYYTKLEMSGEELQKYINGLAPSDAYAQGIFAGFRLVAEYLKQTVGPDMQRLTDLHPQEVDEFKAIFSRAVARDIQSYIKEVIIPVLLDGGVLIWGASTVAPGAHVATEAVERATK